MNLRHQDIVLSVEFQKGKINPVDYLSRKGKPSAQIPTEQQKQALSTLQYKDKKKKVSHYFYVKSQRKTGKQLQLIYLDRCQRQTMSLLHMIYLQLRPIS